MFIPYEVYSGEENMRLDAELLERKEPAFRLYGWSPMCVSIGRNQNLNVQGVDVVRRLTGGRALLHDDEITYSVVCPAGTNESGGKCTGKTDIFKQESVMESYKRISQVLIDAFAKLGIELEYGSRFTVHGSRKNNCMLVSTGADLCYKGKKLIGSAQFRKDGWILQHGSILYDYNPELLQQIFNEPVNGKITCIKEIAPDLSKTQIIDMLQTCNMF
jgi:lipoate-protein ligase A